MPKVSGIDFSALAKARESVTVRLVDGVEVELPLITLRDAEIAESFISRNDAMYIQYRAVVERINHRMEELKEASKSEDNTEKSIDVLDASMEFIKKMNARSAELVKESRALCDEIHEFLRPYLKDTTVIEQLKTIEDVHTIEILELMLYGAAALGESEAVSAEENPTTPQSQKN
jgi:hypothetical protein